MAITARYLIDTNILLRVSRTNDPHHQLVLASLQALEDQKAELCYALQNIAEFWNVCTRPVDRNGYGLSLTETNQSVEYIERKMIFLPDDDRVYITWRQLLVAHNIRGVQVHDARLVAVMLAHGISHILTLNKGDFIRYPGIQAVHPSQLHPSAP